MSKITAQQILDAIRKADEEKPEIDQLGWLEADDMRAVVIDGRLNLERVAEILSAADHGKD